MIIVGMGRNEPSYAFVGGLLLEFFDNATPVIVRHATIDHREAIAAMANIEHVAITDRERFHYAHGSLIYFYSFRYISRLLSV